MLMVLNPKEKKSVHAMAFSSSSSKNNVCTHLTLGLCPCTTINEKQASGSSTKKRKLGQKATNGARKKAACNGVERGWGYSTQLMLYDDPWKIKKVLKGSDLGNLSRLLVATELAEKLVLPVLGGDGEDEIQVGIWDVDTNSMHSLNFKRWPSSGSYVFMGRWVKDFVVRRGLEKGDEVGLHWDPYNNRFNFSVLQTNKNKH